MDIIRKELFNTYKYIITKRKKNHKYKNVKINIFGDYKEKTYGCINYNNDHYHIDIYSCLLKNTPLIFIIDFNLNKNIKISGNLYIDKENDFIVRIISTIDKRTIITILDKNNNPFILSQDIDVYININFKNDIKNDKKNSPKIPSI